MVGEKKLRRYWTIFIFLLPCLIGLIVFNLIPIIQSAILSFTKWNLVTKPEFIGFDNYIKTLSDDNSVKGFLNTFRYASIYMPLVVMTSLVFASILNMKLKFVKLYRALMFIPVLLSWVVVSLLWMWLFNADSGIINYLLSLVGLQGPAWLHNEKTAMWAIIIASLWKDLGYFSIIMLAGLQNISEEMYESASLDGATHTQQFFKITIPLLSPTLFFMAVILTINSMQVFDQVFVMTKGGPYGTTTTIVMQIYANAFKLNHVGFASAQAWLLVAIILFLTLIQNLLQKRWVHYDN